MSEEQAPYNVRDEVDEAMQMLGKGYEPSFEIEAPRKVTTRRGGKLHEEDRPAFIKIYTDFKDELKTIAGDDLKLWLYLALSVNRYTGDARPGLRKIAEDLDLAVNTVQACLERLEKKNLLDIEKATGKGNIYHPSDYVSASRTVSKSDTVNDGTVSKSKPTVSKNGGTVSNQYRKSAQPEEPEEPEKTPPFDFQKSGMEWSVLAGEDITEEMVKAAQLRDVAPKMFEKALGFSKPLPWWDGDKDWRAFGEWVCVEYARNRMSFGEYNTWRNTKFTKGGISNNRLRGFPAEFYDSWDMFRMSQPAEEKHEEYPTLQ